jgi:hypothetical protein
MRNIAFETLIFMEKRQIRFSIGIQKRYTKKESNGKLDPKSIQKDRQKRNAREVFRREVRRAYMSGWRKGVQYGENLEKNKQVEVGEILQSERDRA